MKDVHRLSLLYDFYASLLTPRQQELVRDYYLNDLSLGEIAAELGVSRQAVHDLLRRAEAALKAYEARLGLVSRHGMQRTRLEALGDLLAEAQCHLGPASPAKAPVTRALGLVGDLLRDL